MDEETSRWPTLAGILMIVMGAFRAISGIVGLAHGDWVTRGFNGYYPTSTTSLVWWTLIVGVLLVAGGIAVLLRRTWGKIVGLIVVGLGMLSEFFFVPIYPLWSIVVIVLDAVVIFALFYDTEPMGEPTTYKNVE
jgi:hypothetical protein